MSATVAHHRNAPAPPTSSRAVSIVAGVVTALTVIGTGAYFFARHSARFEDVPKQGTILLKGATSVVGGSPSATLKKLSAADIGTYKVTTVFALPAEGGGYVPSFEGSHSFRVISNDAQEGIQLGITMSGNRSFARSGEEIPRNTMVRHPLEGAEFIVTLGSQGGMLSVQGPEGLDPPGEATMNQLLMAAMEPNKFLTNGMVSKGETWDRKLTGSFFGQPNSSYDITQSIRYEGPAMYDGKSFERCSVTSYSLISNFVTGSSTNFKYTSENLLVQRTVQATGDVYIDPGSGKVQHVILQGRIRSENRQRLIMKDRAEPVDQQPQTNSFPFRNEFHVEYL